MRTPADNIVSQATRWAQTDIVNAVWRSVRRPVQRSITEQPARLSINAAERLSLNILGQLVSEITYAIIENENPNA